MISSTKNIPSEAASRVTITARGKGNVWDEHFIFSCGDILERVEVYLGVYHLKCCKLCTQPSINGFRLSTFRVTSFSNFICAFSDIVNEVSMLLLCVLTIPCALHVRFLPSFRDVNAILVPLVLDNLPIISLIVRPLEISFFARPQPVIFVSNLQVIFGILLDNVTQADVNEPLIVLLLQVNCLV